MAEEDEHAAAGPHIGIGTDTGRGGVIDAQHIDHGANPDTAGGRADADHDDGLAAGCFDGDIVGGVDLGAGVDGGRRGVADEVDADSGRCGADPDRHARPDGEVIEVVPGTHQHGLVGVGAV